MLKQKETNNLISVMKILVCILIVFSSCQVSDKAQEPVFDGKTRLELFDKHVAMKESSQFKDLHWQHLGPTNTSGRCTDIAVAKYEGKPYVVYVAAASGGVWKTENDGETWNPVFDQGPTTSIGDVTVAPSDPNTVWIGTGEANIFRSSMSGCGVYKSTDAGKTWEHMGLADTHTIPRIVIHPTNPDIVYVAAGGNEWTTNPDRGVFKTTDGGKTWAKILYVDDETGANDMVIDPNDPEVLYVSTWQRTRKLWNDPRNEDGYSGSGIYTTKDGGTNWTQINNGLVDARYRGRIGIDIARSNPDVLYAFVDNYELADENQSGQTDSYGRPVKGRIKGAVVYRTDDKGKSWHQVSGLKDKMENYMKSHSATYGWVFAQMRVDPNDENTIYTMGLGLNISEDGGATFSRLRGMHGDHHGLWIDPDNSDFLINVQDGGIVFSYDKGKNWKLFIKQLPLVQFYNVAYDMNDPFYVYGSIQDHGSRRGIVDLSKGRDKIPEVEWEGAPGGEGSSHAIDPTDPNTVYSAGFYGRISRSDMSKTGRDRSQGIMPESEEGEMPYRGQWVAPFILSPHDPNIVYHGLNFLFRSMNRGESWEKISPDLTHNDINKMGDISYQTLFAISESPLQYGLIYAGTDDGRVHVTKDEGKTWTDITEGAAADRWISRLVASKYDLETAYMTQNGKRNEDFAPYVWKSTDYGQTWINIAGNIPLGPVNVIREDPNDKNILYVGTDIGVYVSKNGGKKWEILGDLPSTFVHDLQVHPRDNIIVIATHGRGMWALDANPLNGGLDK
ncbi:WD40/YVTN/BNR-like repeat-containing protein [Bacteroidota bacterium]